VQFNSFIHESWASSWCNSSRVQWSQQTSTPQRYDEQTELYYCSSPPCRLRWCAWECWSPASLVTERSVLQNYDRMRLPCITTGLAVLMASALLVLKHETSTLRQSHNFISIDLTFGVGDYGREVTSPAKFWFGSDERSRRHVGGTYTGPVTI